ncbi:hypothetical protein [Streptomyces turgidiscabies]|uniref:Integral membrane protein n=1 Tax=Streptomyces turgidiscabies TaxID=85558 RepID=A0ABU0RM37_9ACTN|nr:hypothetical protein [Streptomyces turgidiscabies]MDQ0932793.1 hypothetical protein [Streptomyces turgidiscabies]
MAVIALTALSAVTFLVTAILVSFAKADPVGLLVVLPALLFGAVALGLWQGNRGARVVAIVIGVGAFSGSSTPGVYSGALIIYGVTVILLLVAPRSSRAWFTPHR